MNTYKILFKEISNVAMLVQAPSIDAAKEIVALAAPYLYVTDGTIFLPRIEGKIECVPINLI